MSKLVPKIEVITTRTKLVSEREQTVDLLIRILPPEVDSSSGSHRRPAFNLSIVLDRSGPMGGEKMMRAREASCYCIDQLLSTDRLSVITFDDQIEVLIPSQQVRNKTDLKARMEGVHARSSTALHEAWVRGGMAVSEHLTDEAINRVLLVTDGLANVGLTNTDEIVTQAKGLAERGVSTTTIGIGDDFNEDLLVPMAQAGEGNAWHVERPGDMERIFAVELEGLIAQVAHTVSLGLIPSDGVRLMDVLNDFEMTETGRYRLPNLQAGSPVEVVAQLRVPAQATGTRRHLLDLRLGYTPQEMKSAEVIKHSFEMEFDEASVVERMESNADVERAVRLLMNARARREAMARMDIGDFAGARGIITGTLSASAPLFHRDLTPEVMAEHAELQSLESSLDDREQDKLTRKRMSYGSYSRSHSKKRN